MDAYENWILNNDIGCDKARRYTSMPGNDQDFTSTLTGTSFLHYKQYPDGILRFAWCKSVTHHSVIHDVSSAIFVLSQEENIWP